MSKYIGQPCSSCRNVLKDGDDIVVCPVCGSPYHKECYMMEGKCVNTLLHESGSEWHPEPVIVPEPTVEETVCPNCGAHNSKDSFFCTSCGVSLKSDRPNFGQVPPFNDPRASKMPPYQQQNPFGVPNINYQTVSEDSRVDSNTAGDYMKYVGPKFYYYLPKFFKFAKGEGKVSANFAALFFTPFWLFYRKMPLYGIVVLFLRIITSLPSLLEYFAAFDAMSRGVVYTGNTSPAFMLISGLCTLITWSVAIIFGLFGNYLYYKKAKKDIDGIKSSGRVDQSTASAIAAAGGVSMAYVIISLVILTVVSYILTAILMVVMQII